MSVVWKFPLDWTADEQLIEVPTRSHCVRVAVQGEAHGIGTLTMRLVEEPAAETTTRRFVVRGTGHEVDGDATYLGTAESGAFVWHLFELLGAR